MKKIFLLFLVTIIVGSVNAQQLKKGINKDSLFNVSIKNLPQNVKDTLTKEYTSSSEQNREFLLFIVTMPRSSKKEMITNIDSNYTNIAILKSEFSMLVPKNCNIQIEFEPANPNFGMKETIDLRITKVDKSETKVFQDWQLQYNSPKLGEMLKIVNWDKTTLKKIKVLLDKANCISIENGPKTEIGFGRSSLGMYSYLLIDHDLSEKEAKQYNDGCSQIFYKKNIVLEYGGGAAGPQCFPDN